MGNKLDLTGMRFGRLVAQQPAENRGDRTFWLCKCDCGNTAVVGTDLLRGGKTRSCGCLREEMSHKIKNDLTGKRFGRLVVQELSSNAGERRGTFWHCLCDCGTEVDVNAYSLKVGDTRSCGCLAKEVQQKTGASSKGRPSKRLLDLTGQRFGRYVVLKRAANSARGMTRWLCRCDCGNERIVNAAHLRSGHSMSCGCLGLEHATQAKVKHGMSKTPLYRVFLTMHNRCELKSVKGYKRYGGRGIKVCPDWEHFEPFCSWAMENGYSQGLEIDRIDPDKGYCPENCRWITASENASRAHFKHGGSGTPIYARYRNLIKALGAEHICEAWKDFPSFKRWAEQVGLSEMSGKCLVPKDVAKPLSTDNFELITRGEALARRNRVRARKPRQ